MILKLNTLLVSLLMIVPNVVYAKHATREVTVTQLHPISSNRPAASSSENSTRVYVNPGAWGDTQCREDAADLLKEDTHLLSILLIAWTTGKKSLSKSMIQVSHGGPVRPYAKLRLCTLNKQLEFLTTTRLQSNKEKNNNAT